MRVYAVLLEITGKGNCISANARGAAADTCFKSRECNLRQVLIFLSVTSTLSHLELIEMLELLIDIGSALPK